MEPAEGTSLGETREGSLQPTKEGQQMFSVKSQGLQQLQQRTPELSETVL